METKFKTTFASIPGSVRVVQPTEENRKEAKASLSQLKALLPSHIDPNDEPAILFVAANLAVAGLVNLNDDGIDNKTTLEVYKKFEKQFIDLEHDRKVIRGYIIYAGLSEFGTDRILTEEEARASDQPFNIAVVLALWKSVDPELCRYILEASSPSSPDFKTLSLSFEIGFGGYRIIGLPMGMVSIASASIVVRPDEDGFGLYDGKLRANGGDGLSPNDASLRLYRIMDEGVIPLGGGIVTMPAAFVKGMTIIDESQLVQSIKVIDKEQFDRAAQVEAPDEEDDDEHLEIITRARQAAASLFELFNKKDLTQIISPETRVSPITPKPSIMKQSDFKALEEKAGKATKIEEYAEVFASTKDLVTIITEESERREQKRIEAETQAAKLETAKQEIQAAADQLKKDLETVRGELEAIKSAQASAAAEQKFQERMTALTETFDADADTSAFFAEEVKACETDEAFAKKFEKFKKLMPEKTKDFKKKKADEAKASQEKLVAALAEKNVKAKFNESLLEIEEVVASAKGNPIEGDIINLVQPEGDLKERAKKAFAKDFTIGGKTTEQLVSKK